MTSNERTLDDLLTVGRFLKDFPGLWWVGGGWAIDVWVGTTSRSHEDIEICILRNDQEVIHQYCPNWDFYTPVNNEWSRMAKDERLDDSGFMLQLRHVPAIEAHIEGMPPEFEFILNDVENGDWIFRFEPSIRLPLEAVYSVSPFGLPVIAPEILLLHKAWYPSRPKDEHDFATVRNHLSMKQRTWLYKWLKHIRPNHHWLGQLEG